MSYNEDDRDEGNRLRAEEDWEAQGGHYHDCQFCGDCEQCDNCEQCEENDNLDELRDRQHEFAMSR